MVEPSASSPLEPTVETADAVVLDAERFLAPGWVAHGHGRILEVGQGSPPAELGRVRAHPPGSVIIPGLINAHVHLAFGEARHLAHDAPFFSWMTGGVLPAVQAAAEDPDAWLRGARASVRELIEGGVTFAADSFLRSIGARVMREAGLGGIFFQEVFGSLADEDDAYLAEEAPKWDGLEERLEGTPFGYSPHTPWTCPPGVFRHVVERARSEGRRISFHLSESIEEEDFFRRETGPIHAMYADRGILHRWRLGCSPTVALDELGVLGPDLIAAHCVQVDDEDVAILARTGVHVVHCPVSNMKLCEGIAPVTELLEAGVNVALGTDSVASTGRLDLFAEMRAFALAQRARTRDARQADARTAFRMATEAAARALDEEERRGRLAPGLSADLAVLDLGGHRHAPRHDPVQTLVWTASPANVRLVIAAGRIIAGDAVEPS